VFPETVDIKVYEGLNSSSPLFELYNANIGISGEKTYDLSQQSQTITFISNNHIVIEIYDTIGQKLICRQIVKPVLFAL